MLWLLVLHIITMLFWCAALLYLPALVAGIEGGVANMTGERRHFHTLERFLFTHVATPFALAAIISGTLVFMIDGTTAPWLIAKLTLVTAMVVCHALVGLLVLRSEATIALDDSQASGQKSLRPWCLLLAAVVTLLIVAIFWVVLAKPSLAFLL